MTGALMLSFMDAGRGGTVLYYLALDHLIYSHQTSCQSILD